MSTLFGRSRKMSQVPTAYWWQRKHLRQAMKGCWRNIFWVSITNPMPIFLDPLNTYIDPSAEIGAETVIEPNVWIMGKTRIGKNCRIGFGSVIIDSTLEDNVQVTGARIEKSCVEHDAAIGYTAQLKRTHFGAFSKMPHHGYLGDCEVGHHVNIGAGTITSNYDGAKKNKTVINDYAFIGTNVNLVAPIVIPEGAMIAAGSTITGKNKMPSWSLVIARPEFHVSRTKRIRWDEKGWHIEERKAEE